jgi:hypothetical protein
VPRREEYVPKHRGPAPEPAVKKRVRSTVLFSGVAVAATGLAVTSGILSQQDAVGDNANTALRAAPRLDSDTADQGSTAELADRGRSVSRSDRRTSVDKDKVASLDQSSGGQATRKEDLSDADPRDIARAMLPKFGFSSDQFGCLDSLYMSESDWDPTADNPTSSAYGIPQALTETHDDLPADYMTNPASQIEWGLDYIRSSYGTPCSAWEFKQANNWY